MTCDELQDVAAELALGVLPGSERADALRHLARCPTCRHEVDELAMVADSLLLLAPEVEPPLGFESRVSAGLVPSAVASTPATRRAAGRWRRPFPLALTAAAALVLVLLAGVLLGRGSSGDGSSVYHAALRTSTGDKVGNVYAFDGDGEPWVFMSVADREAEGTYDCVVRLAGGGTRVLGRFTVDGGWGTWGKEVDGIHLDDVDEVLIRTPEGRVIARAPLET